MPIENDGTTSNKVTRRAFIQTSSSTATLLSGAAALFGESALAAVPKNPGELAASPSATDASKAPLLYYPDYAPNQLFGLVLGA